MLSAAASRDPQDSAAKTPSARGAEDSEEEPAGVLDEARNASDDAWLG